MISHGGMAPIHRSRTAGGAARHPRQLLALSALAVVASCAALVMLARQSDAATLDYGVGILPAVVPRLAACLSILAAVLWLSGRRLSSAAVSLLLGALMVVTAWSVVMLPFDALRLVGLVPLALSAWGAGTRLVLLVAGAAALVPALKARRASQGRCSVCRRALPGRIDRLPRWPVGVAVASALVYPTLRTVWALGGTFGTAGAPLQMDGAVAWGTVIVGAASVAFAIVLLVGKGPRWVRTLIGLGGTVLGLMMAMVGGLGAVKAATTLATEGLDSVTGDLMTWTFVFVYSSWFVAGLGIIVGGWRFWAHRRDACSGCGTLMGMS
jgi:hypothetical protein